MSLHIKFNTTDGRLPVICMLISVTADCGTLPNITNGAVDLSGGTAFPSVALYSCDGGYELQGDPVRMCNESGVWTGTEPICTGKIQMNIEYCVLSFSMDCATLHAYLALTDPSACDVRSIYLTPICFISTVLDCGILPNLTNGFVSYNPDTTFQSVASYTCEVGFSLSVLSERVCNEIGQWSGAEPECVDTSGGEEVIMLSNQYIYINYYELFTLEQLRVREGIFQYWCSW